MKTKYSFPISFFYVGLICAVFSHCSKSKSASGTPTHLSISKLVSTATNLTLLDTAFMKTGLDSFFNQSGPYTLFVSADQNWILAGLADSTVHNLTDSQLNKIILYGAINGGIPSAQLPAGPNTPQTTLSGDSVFITNNSSGIFLDGIKVIASDVIATNGYINALAQPLVPPTGTLIQVVQADSSFAYFSAALTRTGAGQTNVNQILTSGNIYTLFLPTNDAFRTAGYLTTDSINATDPDSLANLLTYHIVPGRVFTSDFSADTTKSTLLGDSTISLQVLGGVAYYVQGLGNLISIPLGRSNIMARNGVVHVIGQLLLP
jgi:uncharacterized surface protein with fasciclin (FAS1) repeats